MSGADLGIHLHGHGSLGAGVLKPAAHLLIGFLIAQLPSRFRREAEPGSRRGKLDALEIKSHARQDYGPARTLARTGFPGGGKARMSGVHAKIEHPALRR